MTQTSPALPSPEGSLTARAKRIFSAALGVLRGRGAAARGAQTAITNIIILLINLITGVLTARVMGPDGRGILLAVSLWPQLLAYCLTLGLPSALVFHLRRTPERSASLITTALVLGLAAGSVMSLVGLLVLPALLGSYDADAIRMAQTFMVLAPISTLGVIVTAVLQCRDNFSQINMTQFGMALITLLAQLVLALWGALTPLAAALALLLPPVPILAVNLWTVFGKERPTFRSFHTAGRDLLHYGLRSYPMEAVLALAPSLDRVVLVGLLPAHDMGLYAVARSIAQPLMMLPNAAAMVLFPKAVQRETVEIVTLTGHVSRVTIALTSVIALFYALSGTVLLPILYGAQFEESLSVFRIFVMETVIAGWIWVLLQAFMAAGRPGVVSAAQICGLVMSGILVFFLARIAGLEGAAWALLAASLCRLALLYGAFKPVLGTPAPWPLLTVNDLRGVGVRLFGTPKPAR